MARQLYDTWECGQYAESHTECIILLRLLKSGRLKYRREATAVATLATTTAVATAGAVAPAPWSAVVVLEYCALGEMLAVGESLGHTVLVMCLGRKD